MKSSAVLPAALMEYSHECHFGQMYNRSRTIYLLVLFIVAGAFAALFFVHVPITITANGALVAPGGRSWIKAPVSGRVAAVYVRENQRVARGQRLFKMESALLEEDISQLINEEKAMRRKTADLRQLLRVCGKRRLFQEITPQSGLYAREYALFNRKVVDASDRIRKAASVCRRNELLFSDGVLAAAEFEKYRFALRQARNELYLLYEDQGSRWQSALNRLHLELEKLLSRKAKLRKQRELYSVRAPSGGVLQEMDGLRAGSFYSQGARMVRLSPDSGLLVKALISPVDIGLIKKEMPVRIHVDAFNYRQAGPLKGMVAGISGDVLFQQDGNPWFEVSCALDKPLQAPDMVNSENLIMGMQVQVRFIVAERTLFQLLQDNINDWLDPYAKGKS